MAINRIKLQGSRIKPSKIKQTWEKQRALLSESFPQLAQIVMPPIEGQILNEAAYESTLKGIADSSRKPEDTGTGPGENVLYPSSITFQTPRGWTILKCAKRRSLEEVLERELWFIWEKMLNLEMGTLTDPGRAPDTSAPRTS